MIRRTNHTKSRHTKGRLAMPCCKAPNWPPAQPKLMMPAHGAAPSSIPCSRCATRHGPGPQTPTTPGPSAIAASNGMPQTASTDGASGMAYIPNATRPLPPARRLR